MYPVHGNPRTGLLRTLNPSGDQTGFLEARSGISVFRTIAIASDSALTEPNRQKSRRKKGFGAWKSQPEIASDFHGTLKSQCSIAFSGALRKGPPISWVAKLKGDKDSECKLSNGWSRSYREINMLLFAGI